MNGLNGETAFSAEDVTVGYVAGGPYGYKKRNLRVTVSVRMEWLTRQDVYETTGHEEVSRPLDFAITTAVWRPDGRDMVSGGATVEPLTELRGYADGWTPEAVAALVELSAWHLNGMTAGCDHVEPVIETDKYGRETASLDLTPACPYTGYRYGHAWLVRVLPDGFLNDVQAIFAES
jgi:hypothetical protein